MSNDRYYDEVLAYITKNGETGVNELAKAVNIPLSTMQRYLVGQSYFRKTISRKWDIPNNVDADIQSNTMTLMVESVEVSLKLLDSQIAEIHSSVKNALLPVNTLKRGIISQNPPVADKSVKLDNNIETMMNYINAFKEAVKRYMSNVPEEYQDLLKNLDISRLCVEMGTNYVNSKENSDLTSVLLGKGEVLTEQTLKIIEQYQKRA